MRHPSDFMALANRSRPLVSIVVPTKNSSRFIAFALRSIKLQTYSNYEVIFIDAQSEDCTLDVCKSFAFPSASYLSQTAATLPGALNEAFSCAAGQIFCWLNSDDFYTSEYVLESVVNLYEKGFAFVYGHSHTVAEDGTPLRLHLTFPYFSRYQRLLTSLNLLTASMFFSQKHFMQFGGFSEELTIAFEYPLIDFLIHHSRHCMMDKCLAAYRLHDNQLSEVYSRQMSDQAAMIDQCFQPSLLQKTFVPIIAYLLKIYYNSRYIFRRNAIKRKLKRFYSSLLYCS